MRALRILRAAIKINLLCIKNPAVAHLDFVIWVCFEALKKSIGLFLSGSDFRRKLLHKAEYWKPFGF